MAHQPQVVILAGPNGAGKSTTAPRLLSAKLGIAEFVNADVIAQGLSAFNPEHVAFRAGRLLLHQIHELAKERANFAFETTLASRSFAPLIRRMKLSGYWFRLFFLWLPSPEMAIDRVAERVRLGGHSVPVETIRRRYLSGIANFVELYQPLADQWTVYDNSLSDGPRLVASGGVGNQLVVVDPQIWNLFK